VRFATESRPFPVSLALNYKSNGTESLGPSGPVELSHGKLQEAVMMLVIGHAAGNRGGGKAWAATRIHARNRSEYT